MDHRFLFSVFARLNPAIWDVINQGAIGVTQVQSFAAREHAELNPQPLPPLAPEVVGALVGVELARLSWTADKLGSALSPVADWEDNPCGNGPHRLRLPWWVPVPDPGPEPWWLAGYYLGLAATLATTGGDSKFLGDAFDRTVSSLSALDTSLDLGRAEVGRIASPAQ